MHAWSMSKSFPVHTYHPIHTSNTLTGETNPLFNTTLPSETPVCWTWKDNVCSLHQIKSDLQSVGTVKLHGWSWASLNLAVPPAIFPPAVKDAFFIFQNQIFFPQDLTTPCGKHVQQIIYNVWSVNHWCTSNSSYFLKSWIDSRTLRQRWSIIQNRLFDGISPQISAPLLLFSFF